MATVQFHFYNNFLFIIKRVMGFLLMALLLGAWDNYSSPICIEPRDFPGLDSMAQVSAPDTPIHFNVVRSLPGTYRIDFNRNQSSLRTLVEFELQDFKTCQLPSGKWIMEISEEKPYWIFDSTYREFPTVIYFAREIEWSPIVKAQGRTFQSLNTRQLNFDHETLRRLNIRFTLSEGGSHDTLVQTHTYNHLVERPSRAAQALTPWVGSSWNPLFVKPASL